MILQPKIDFLLTYLEGRTDIQMSRRRSVLSKRCLTTNYEILRQSLPTLTSLYLNKSLASGLPWAALKFGKSMVPPPSKTARPNKTKYSFRNCNTYRKKYPQATVKPEFAFGHIFK